MPDTRSKADGWVGIRLTADVIIEMGQGGGQIVLVRRRFSPPGWALPGGFVEPGESLEEAAVREAEEETGLQVQLIRQFHAYSAPGRDPRGQTVTMVFVGQAQGQPRGGDDAAEAALFHAATLPDQVAFDHRRILEDYFQGRY
ncbi:MAG: NUDIX domain-containing protein [Acidobacteriota bacterium]